MRAEFMQIEWSPAVERAMATLITLALDEDFPQGHDWTTTALVPPDALGRGAIVARKPGIVAGMAAGPLVLAQLEVRYSASGEIRPATAWRAMVTDGDEVGAGTLLAELTGSARTILSAERTILNMMGHLSGIATLTASYVRLLSGLACHVYDTRKTLPGWRLPQKYAVRMGGGRNHRLNLSAAVLIKDNHLQFGITRVDSKMFRPAEAVERAKALRARLDGPEKEMLIEVEVDRLAQLEEVLSSGPDIVLLDNFLVADLRRAVEVRDRWAPQISLEASGGVHLGSIREIAETGVDRISVGALTHSAPALDLALDW